MFQQGPGAAGKGENLIAGIGQGSVLATPLQIRDHGCAPDHRRAVLPPLVRATGVMQAAGDPVCSDFTELGIDPAALGIVLDGMNAVANVPGGTAYAERITEPGFAMGGTSQVRRITQLRARARTAQDR